MITRKHGLWLAAAAFATSLAVAAPAAAQEFSEWDTDKSAGLNAEEFNAGFGENGVYDAWDANDDNNLTEDEFNAGVFGGYDRDDDGMIEEPEFGDYGDDIGDGGFFDV